MTDRSLQSQLSFLMFIALSLALSLPAKADIVVNPSDWVPYEIDPISQYYEFPEYTYIARMPGANAYFKVGADAAPIIGPNGISFTLDVERTFSLSAFHGYAANTATHDDETVSVTLEGDLSNVFCSSGGNGPFSQSGNVIKSQGIFVCTHTSPPLPQVAKPVTLTMTNYTILDSFPASTPTPTPTPAPTPSGNLSQPSQLSSPTSGANVPKVCPTPASGSIIHVDNRSVGEKVDVVGAPFSLYYFSDRVSGRKDNNTIHIPLTSSNPTGVLGVILNIQYGNQTFNQFFPDPVPNFAYDFQWDGRDENGNLVSGSLPAYIAVVYLLSDGTAPYALSSVLLGGNQALSAEKGLGGWTPSNHHFYDVTAKAIRYGSGISLPADAISYHGGLLVSSSDGSEAYLFDSNGRHLETRSTLTNSLVVSFGYDSNGVLISETDAFGNQTLINHYGTAPSSIVSPYGQITQLAVDQNGYLSKITDPAGSAYAMSYSSDGLLKSFTKPNGHTSQITYDSVGKLVKDLGAAGDSSTFSESVANGITTIQKLSSMNRATLYSSADDGTHTSRGTRAPSGEVTSTVESTFDSKVSTSDSLVVQSTSAADDRFGSMAPVETSQIASIANTTYTTQSSSTQSVSLNNSDVLSINQLARSTVIDGLQSQTYQAKYDGNSRTQTTLSPEGQSSKVVYDANGKIVSLQRGQLASTSLAYDSKGRPTSIAQGSRKTVLSYDSLGNVASVKDPQGLTTSMKYDLAGRIIQQTRPDGKSVKYSYDASGNLVSLTPANNFAHIFSVNLSDDPASYTPPKVGNVATGSTLYSYNLDKQLTQVTNPDGSSISYNYDPATAQLLSVSGSSGSVKLSYDQNSKKVSRLQTSSGVETNLEYVGPLKTKESTSSVLGTQALLLDYSNNMQLSSVALNSRAGLERAIQVAYDRDRQPIQIGDEHFVRDAQSGLLKSASIGVVSQALNYNKFGEQVSDYYKSGSKQIYSADMTRNANGQITQRLENVAGKKIRYDYAYDNLSRLTSMKIDGFPVLSYSYDANGNRLSTNALFGLIKIKEKYDEQDRLLSFGDISYSYDKMGNRIKKSLALGKNKSSDTAYSYNSFGQLASVVLPNGKKIEYVIDGLGRRIGKKLNGKLVQGFIYQSQTQIAAETDGNGVVVKRFIYGEKPNVPDYMITKEGMFRLITDQVGTLRMIVDTSNGKIVDESISTAFGEITLDCKRFFTPFGFAGGLYDRDTGLLHFGEREYDAEVGRWISKDPILFVGGENLYSYDYSDPINLTDPNGTCPTCVIGAAIGAAVNGYSAIQANGSTKQVILSVALGAATGFLSGTGVSIIGAAITGAISSLANNAGNQIIFHKQNSCGGQSDESPQRVVNAAVVGAVGGALTGGLSGKLASTFYPLVQNTISGLGGFISGILTDSGIGSN